MLIKTTQVGDLVTPKTNPAASKADIRAPRTRAPKPVSAPPVMGAGAPSPDFEAMLAMGEAQNQIIGKVLDGPVSQQTQRQLARLKESNSRGQLAKELSQGKTPALAEALLKNHALDQSKVAKEPAKEVSEVLAAYAETAGAALQSPAGAALPGAAPSASEASGSQAQASRRPISLAGGATIAAGVDTGKVFSPSQLSAFRQKNGLALAPGRSAPAEIENAQLQGAIDWNAADGAKRLTRGATLEKRSAEALAKPEVEIPQDAVKKESEPSKPLSLSSSDIDTIVDKVGQALGLDPSLIKAVIKTESNFNHKAVSPAGAQGLMQLMPGTAKEMGVKDPFSPLDNIWGGARYLKRMLDSHGGNLNRALAAYNWGPGNLQKYGNKRMPRETRRYIEVVNRNYASFKKQTARA